MGRIAHTSGRTGCQSAFSRPLQEFRYPLLENAHQGGIHERELIRDVETHDALTLEVAFEGGRQFFQVSLLHHEDDVGPLDELRIEWSFSVVVDAGRSHYDIGPGRKHLLRSRASEPVLAANEEEVLHSM